MTEIFLGFTGALYGWLLTYLLHSTLLLVAVWVLVRLGRVRHPATQDLFWKVALVGSLVTATASTLRDAPSRTRESGRVAIRAVRRVPGTAAVVTAGPSSGVVRWHRGAASEARGVGLNARVAQPTESCRAALESLPEDPTDWPRIVGESCHLPRSFLWQHGVVLLWLVGSLFPLGALVRRRLALRDALGFLEPAGPRARGALGRILRVGPAVSTELMTSTTVGTPCVVRGSTIVLPDRCEAQFTDDELDAVLAHELAHVQRRDVTWLAVLRALEAVFWFQPLNRVGVTGALVATELDCDDRALERTGQPLGLARSVARVAEWSVLQPIQPEVAMAGEGRHLSTRVRRILAPRRPEERLPRWIRVTAVSLALAPLFLLPSVPGAPVVRGAVLYPAELTDGSGAAFMLLDAATALGELPQAADEEAAPVDGQALPESGG